jgi:hypothetical protein
MEEKLKKDRQSLKPNPKTLVASGNILLLGAGIKANQFIRNHYVAWMVCSW